MYKVSYVPKRFETKIFIGDENTSLLNLEVFTFTLNKRAIFSYFQLWEFLKQMPVKILRLNLFKTLFPYFQVGIDEKTKFLGTFLASSKKPFYKANRVNGRILFCVSVEG